MKRSILNVSLKGQIFICALLLLSVINAFSGNPEIAKTGDIENDSSLTKRKSEIIQNIMNMPISFRPNNGQWENNILFQAASQNGNIYFMNNCLSFAHRRDLNSDATETNGGIPGRDYEILVWNIHLDGINPNTHIYPFGKKESRANYFINNKQITNVPDYSEIIYKDIYDRIDLKFYNASKDLEYDYILKPGADVNNIRRTVDGIEKITINKTGAIEFTNKWGIIQERKPYAYQIVNGKETEIPVQFSLINDKTYGFKITGKYDLSKELIIDPVLLEWSTFVGGTAGAGTGNINDISVGGNFANPAIFGTGYYNASYPVTPGVYDNTFNGGEDVFVFRLDGTGTNMLWATYVGGAGNDRGQGILARTMPDVVYVTGYTASAAFPTTPGVLSPAYMGGGSDAFCFQLDGAAGALMIWSTFLGGTSDDYGTDVRVDGGGVPYYTGYTKSTDFPTTVGAFDVVQNGGYDAYFTKLNLTGTATMYSSYIGGSGDDYGNGITINTFGTDRVFIVGSTNSANFPVTAGAFDAVYNLGDDAFVFCFDAPGGNPNAIPLYSTYLGGPGNESAANCYLNFANQVAVTGYTNSVGFPTTLGAYDITQNGGYDVFITVMNQAGNAPLYSTFVGGGADDYGEDVVYGFGGMGIPLFVAGTTSSADFPTTCQAYDKTYNGGISDNFLLKINCTNGAAAQLLYSSFFGGTNKDYNACLYSDYSLSHMGCEGVLMGYNSHSFDFPTTAGVFQSTKLNEATPGLNPQPGVLLLRSSAATEGFTYTSTNCSLTVSFTAPPCTQWTFDGPYTGWSWSFGDATNSSLENPTHTYAAPGTYTIWNSNWPSCGGGSPQTITVGVPPTLVPSSSNLKCFGGNNGSASVTPSGGKPGYTYNWNNGATGQTNTGLTQGIYTVTVTDNNGCTKTATTSITQPPANTVSISSVTIKCFGGTTTATATGGGGTPAYTYLWNAAGQTNATATGLTQGTYTVTVTDNQGCTATSTTSITQPPATTAGISPGTISCFGGTTIATASGGGGTPAYTYLWNATGQTTAIATGLVQGTYTVTVTDNKGCTATSTTSITQPSVIAASISSGTINCFGGKTTATAAGNGGTPAYTYLWNATGQTTAIATGLPQGTYTVTITDNKGCTATSTISITQPIVTTASISTGTISCFGGITSATATGGGGTPAYTYLWNPTGQTTATATGLPQGTYTVTITDNKGCTTTSSSSITQPQVLSASISVTNASCGSSNGSAVVTANGGTGTLTYNWSSGGSALTASGLSSGNYSVTVTDAKGCTSITNATVNNTSGGTATISIVSNVNCKGGNNGSVTATTVGGIPTFTYSWSNSASGATISGLTAGSYTVTVKDGSGCQSISTVSITEPASSTATITSGTINCSGGTTSATATAGGGTPAYTYIWSTTGQTTAIATGLSQGNYTITVTDSKGCTTTATTAITSPQPIVGQFTKGTATCAGCGGCKEWVLVNATGGNSPYTYLWQDGYTKRYKNQLCPGTSVINIIDKNGCTINVHVSTP